MWQRRDERYVDCCVQEVSRWGGGVGLYFVA